MCKTGRKSSRTSVRKLSGMVGGQESAFGVKFTYSRFVVSILLNNPSSLSLPYMTDAPVL